MDYNTTVWYVTEITVKPITKVAKEKQDII